MTGRRILAAVATCALGLAITACGAPAAAPTAAPTAAPKAAPTAPPQAAPTAAPKAAITAAPAAAPKAPAKAEKNAIRLAYLTGYFDSPTLIAMREKLFEQEGLQMEYQGFSLGRNAVSAMIAGSLDVAPMGAQPFITATSKGEGGIVVIATVQYHGRGASLVVGKNSTIQKIEDLKGKKIGAGVGTVTHYVLTEKYLPSFGLKASDYQVVNIDQPNLLSALSVGGIDAFAGVDPYPVQAEQEGIGRVIGNLA